MKIILASASPRRSLLLRQAGIDFDVIVSDFAELAAGSLTPDELARQNAEGKAVSVGDNSLPVLAADTVVTIDGKVLGKPRDAAEAAAMLRSLSGREHTVITGVCLFYKGVCRSLRELTTVRLRALPDAEIADYIATGEFQDKAGAYAIQGMGALLVEKIDGCYFNVMGLPLARVVGLLKEAGIGFAYKKSAAG